MAISAKQPKIRRPNSDRIDNTIMSETPPKLFISYSWTTPDHEAWVVELATRLRESGVHAILDKWDLREGQDGHAFMEQMVTDSDIGKVLLVCDKRYAQKANDRTGGVGTETQIITPAIYNQQRQEKFVAVVTERNEAGEPYVPAFYGSRIFIDLSDSGRYAENFDQLLRWIFDQPLQKRPPISRKPAYLADEDQAVALGTGSRFTQAVDAIRNNRDNAMAFVTEYFEVLTAELERLRITPKPDIPFDDLFVQSIEAFLPYRNQAITIFLSLARNSNADHTITVVHRFFEGLIPYLDRPKDATSWSETDFENFKFIVHELFLYAMAGFIRYQRFDAASHLMTTEYYLGESLSAFERGVAPFGIFREPLTTLKYRNERLALRRLSLHADLLKERSRDSAIDFLELMQADFVLFLRDHLDRPDMQSHWFPDTLLYACDRPRGFEIFESQARQSSSNE